MRRSLVRRRMGSWWGVCVYDYDGDWEIAPIKLTHDTLAKDGKGRKMSVMNECSDNHPSVPVIRRAMHDSV